MEPRDAESRAFFERREQFVRHGIPHDVHLKHIARARKLRARAWWGWVRALCNCVQDFVRRVGEDGWRRHEADGDPVPIYEDEPPEEPNRCVIVVDDALGAGRAANAVAIVAFTLGKRHPDMAGPELVDASGYRHPGLIPIGIAVLNAPKPELPLLRNRALTARVDVVAFPAPGQETTDYRRFGAEVARVPTEELSYAGIGFFGPRKAVGRIIGKYPLLK